MRYARVEVRAVWPVGCGRREEVLIERRTGGSVAVDQAVRVGRSAAGSVQTRARTVHQVVREQSVTMRVAVIRAARTVHRSARVLQVLQGAVRRVGQRRVRGRICVRTIAQRRHVLDGRAGRVVAERVQLLVMMMRDRGSRVVMMMMMMVGRCVHEQLRTVAGRLVVVRGGRLSGGGQSLKIELIGIPLAVHLRHDVLVVVVTKRPA